MRANKKWDAKNKDKQRIYRYRSMAKKFIREIATEKDLDDLLEIIKQRKQNIQDED